MKRGFDASALTLPGGRDVDIGQFIRFLVVGAIQNGINIGMFALGVSAGVPFLLAATLAALIALAVSFSLNRRWTFPDSTDRTAVRAIRFVAIWVIILLVGLACLAAFVELVHIPKVLAQTIVVVVGAPLSYLAQRHWTFASAVPHTGMRE
jgi:putative flippase GtrA